MKNGIVDNITEELFQIFPIVMKKLLRIEYGSVLRDISRQDMAIMGMLYQSGTLPISEIGRGLLISKPQMTHIIDKLIRLEIVERLPDKTDRRVINIELTTRGRMELEKNRNSIRSVIRKKLSSLEKGELEELSDSLKKIRQIGAKLE